MTQGPLPDATEVVVAGAGVAGSALAYELGKRGVATVLLDQSPGGPSGASTVPAALINPHRGRTARATTADTDGAKAFWRLTRELRTLVNDSGAYQSGVLRVADNARQARNWQKVAGTEWLEPGEVPAPYHAPHGGLLVPGGGWIDTRALLSALAAAAALRSAQVRWGSELVGVNLEGGLHALVRSGALESTMSIRCQRVVIATGAWQPERLQLPRLELVWGEARVLQLGFTPPLPLAGSVVAAFRDGRAMVSGGHRHVGWLGRPNRASESTTASPSQAAGSLPWEGPAANPAGSGTASEPSHDSHLSRALAWHLPAAADAPELARWQGVRAKRPSGEPVVRRVAPGVHLMTAFGGRGFLRAALAAERLANELAAQLR